MFLFTKTTSSTRICVNVDKYKEYFFVQPKSASLKGNQEGRVCGGDVMHLSELHSPLAATVYSDPRQFSCERIRSRVTALTLKARAQSLFVL